MERQLKAILAADVVGYSRLMGCDEVGTLSALKEHMAALVEPKIAEHRGRLIKLMGDGALVAFASVVDAVQCAVEIQQTMRDRTKDLPEERRIMFRIGINVGDVIVDGDDVYGDGVNVAARLEALAEPGGICISHAARDQVIDKVPIRFTDLGVRSVKNISRPIHIYYVLIGNDGRSGRQDSATPPTGHSRPSQAPPRNKSIVVLAFENMSRDEDQAYFADGIAEDIITDLSKLSGLFVISRNSAFAYKGKNVDLRKLSEELGVRYVLEGSVRKAGNRVRVTAQLIDGMTGGHVWADRFDRELTDIFEVQDELTREIVSVLAPKLTDEEKQLSDRGTEDVEAYDFFLRGRDRVWRHQREDGLRGQEMLKRAIELDPGFSAAHAFLGFAHALAYVNGWTENPEASLAEADALARRAVTLDEREPHAHFVLAIVRLWNRRHDEAIAAAERAIELRPNFTDAFGVLGQILIYAGRPEEGAEMVRKTMNADPHFNDIYFHFLAQAYAQTGNHADAIAALKKRLLVAPNSETSLVLLASCYGHLGQLDAARAAWTQALEINPRYSIEQRRRILPYRDPAPLDDFIDGLRRADLI